MPSEDFAIVEVDGSKLDAWAEYSCDSDIFTPTDGFSLSIGVGSSDPKKMRKSRDYLKDWIKPGSEIKIYIGGNWKGYSQQTALQLVGIVDRRSLSCDFSGGTVFTISGRDKAALLTDASVDPAIYKKAGSRFIDLAKEACKPWNIKISVDAKGARDVRTGKASNLPLPLKLSEEARELGIPPAEYRKILIDKSEALDKPIYELIPVTPSASARAAMANSLTPIDIQLLTVQEASPQNGESVYEFLDRHARRLGILMRMSPDGKLVLTSMNYVQRPLYRLIRTFDGSGNNILSGGEELDSSSQYSSITVYGKQKNTDTDLPREKISSTIVEEDNPLPFDRPLIVHDSSIRTEEEAERRANREMAKARSKSQVLNYTVAGHSNNGYLFATDTIATVIDEVIGVSGEFYVSARNFKKSRSNGTTTELTLIPTFGVVL